MDKKKIYQYIAGTCFAVIALFNLISLIQYFSFWSLVLFLAKAMIAVSLFTSMLILSAVGAGILAVYELIQTIISITNGVIGIVGFQSSLFFSIVSLLFLSAYYFLLAIASLNKKSAKTIGLSAAVIIILRLAVVVIRNLIYSSGTSRYVTSFQFILSSILFAAGAYFLGIVFSDIKVSDYNSSSTAKITTGNNSSDQIEKLAKLKGFLDSGLITQEEFDTKKKQILGL